MQNLSSWQGTWKVSISKHKHFHIDTCFRFYCVWTTNKKNCWLSKAACYYLLFRPVVCSGFFPCYSRQYTVVCLELRPFPYIHLEATGQAKTHLNKENAEVLAQLMHELHVHHKMQVTCCISITLNVKLQFFLNWQ